MQRAGRLENISLNFVELDGASDAMLMGFPTLTDLGFALDRDVDGHVWVSLRKLGVTLLAEVPNDEDKVFTCLSARSRAQGSGGPLRGDDRCFLRTHSRALVDH